MRQELWLGDMLMSQAAGGWLGLEGEVCVLLLMLRVVRAA